MEKYETVVFNAKVSAVFKLKIHVDLKGNKQLVYMMREMRPHSKGTGKTTKINHYYRKARKMKNKL